VPIGSGRLAWVTGGSSGIGAAVASRLAGEGAEVVVLDIQEPASGAVRWQRLDLADRDEVTGQIPRLAAANAWPDIVVLCAGQTANAPIDGYPLEYWDRLLAVNLTGALLVVRDTLPRMCERRYGRIVAISSGTAMRPGAGTAGYAASKAGLIALMKVAAIEGALAGVTANTVAPGITDTP
jgi:NAD(P)-dependent dehydrogenase (short-subunit alcohol dehydrogenase family)